MKTLTLLAIALTAFTTFIAGAQAAPLQNIEIVSVDQLELTSNDEGRPVIFLTAQLNGRDPAAPFEMAIPAGGDPIKVVVPRHRALFQALEAARKEKVSFSVSGEHSTRGGHTIFQVKKITFEIP